ncbi:GTP-binding protein [Promethearchaeum syntrophicum]|uniref:GTP-binding protein n=1 Tax=Promethearchaeum syntrophicum TaxID=2594042 RepID=A0A5B9D6N5_9ARCH|nr:GTP-binding protein [Candidatus Prometheoarchaeum syntrophicum]QEE14702.1 Ras family protein [Candidatus Prometheoarchaeum syntrophicum]
MVVIADGRFELPERYLYSSQHVFLDTKKKIAGLDQIGYAYLSNPTEFKVLVEEKVQMNEPIAVITTDRGITTLYSPCAGKIKTINQDPLKNMELDTYTKGFILEFESISEIDPTLITGDKIEPWANHEVKTLLKNEYSFKVIEIGDSAAGKTAIKVRFTDDYFKQDLKTTLGVDFGSKELKCEYIADDTLFAGVYHFNAKLNVWDAAGQAHFEKIRGMYYRDAKGALLCFDVNNPVSFKNLDTWVDELDENVGRKVPVLLVGNKIDLERRVKAKDAEDYAEKRGFIGYVECSAKTGIGIQEAFMKLALAIYKYEEGLS